MRNLLTILLLISTVFVHAQSPVQIYNSLVREFKECPSDEEDWDILMQSIDDSIDDLDEISISELDYQSRKSYESIREKIEGARSLVGELNPYDGRNYSLTNEKRARGTNLFDDAGAEYRDWYDGSKDGITMFYISVWGGCHMVRLMYNRNNCLHTFKYVGLKGNSMSGGVSADSFRYLETITLTTNNQKYRSFTFEETTNQFGCN